MIQYQLFNILVTVTTRVAAIYPDVLFWPVLEQCGNMTTVVNGDEQPSATQEQQTP